MLLLAPCIILCAAIDETGPGDSASWTLETADTRLVLTVRDGGVAVTELRDRPGGHDWATADSAMALFPRVVVGGDERAVGWSFVGGTIDPKGNMLTLEFASDAPALTLRSIWRAYDGRGPIEHEAELANRSGQTIVVTSQDSLSLPGLRPPDGSELWWIRRGGSNADTQGGVLTEALGTSRALDLVSKCDDGASPVPWVAVQQGGVRGLYLGWGFSGPGRIRVVCESGGLSLRAGNLDDFRTDVPAGETFHLPPAFVGCYEGELDSGANSLHRFIIERLRPPMPAGTPDPALVYNLYLDAGGPNATESDVLRSAAFCADLGFEYFMPDAMWFPETGDWRFDPKRFPKGVEPIRAFVNDRGMRLALWCAWTNGGVSADPGALSVRGPVGRPDWFNADYDAAWQPGPFYGGQVCLACDEARAWAVGKTAWLVSHHGLDYLKHDCGPIVTQCPRDNHRHRYGTDAGYWAAMGYYEVQEGLLKRFPGLILENCSGGGHIKDFGVIRRTHYTVTTDTLSNLPNRRSLYDSTYAFPPILLQAYTYNDVYPVPGDGPGMFLWRSAMMGAWQIDPTRTAEWTVQEKAGARRAAETYKTWVRPLLQDAWVHHVLPRPDGSNWDGMFYWSAACRYGILFIFRPGSETAEQRVRLKGLTPDAEYMCWGEDGSVEPGIRSGSALMDRGLDVSLPSEYTCDLVVVRDASLGAPEGLTPPAAFQLDPPSVQSKPLSVEAAFSWQPSAGATSYRLQALNAASGEVVVDTQVFDGTSVDHVALPPGSSCRWRVLAMGPGGQRWHYGEEPEFTAPPLGRLAGTEFVSDMEWIQANAGADNEPRRDVNYYGRAIKIAGKVCPKGVWTHSLDDDTPADIVLALAGKGYRSFVAEVGLDDASGGGSVEFEVLVDGELRGRSGVVRPGQRLPLEVDVAGANTVTLRVRNAGDGYMCDHAVWGLARFLTDPAHDPIESEL